MTDQSDAGEEPWSFWLRRQAEIAAAKQGRLLLAQCSEERTEAAFQACIATMDAAHDTVVLALEQVRRDLRTLIPKDE